jgi:glutamyl/glutaminyl-tRNA synthetase
VLTHHGPAFAGLQQGKSRLTYRGRLAPSPTGLLHLGHARTFWIAQQRARASRGVLVLRNEDLDAARFKLEFVAAMIEDLKWFGFEWQEGPDCGGPYGPYHQTGRREFYLSALRKLQAGGYVYPCTCSRSDVLRALAAPHQGEDEPVYPGTCRPKGARCDVSGVRSETDRPAPDTGNLTPDTPFPDTQHLTPDTPFPGTRINWRFRVPDGETISFEDVGCGPQQFVAGRDFGDFVVWRHDDVPAYQLSVVVDDAAMQITEVVRGEDLLKSTARQLLLYRALGHEPPGFYHCPLMLDEKGVRLAKRHDALSLRKLREQGATPEQLSKEWLD